MKKTLLLSFVLSLAHLTFSQNYKTESDLSKIPPAPDYTQMSHWIAHPETEDKADLVPGKKN